MAGKNGETQGDGMTLHSQQHNGSAETDLPLGRDGHPLCVEQARERLAGLDPAAKLRWASETFQGHFAAITSFGIQSAVMLELLQQVAPGTPVIWVDTGYLPAETYRYAEILQDKLRIDLHVAQASMTPARMEALHGRLWESGNPEDLDRYHQIRKVEPLEASLSSLNVHCWASGVRGAQTTHRQTMGCLDVIRQRWSLRPLLDWTSRDVYSFMEAHQLPQHPLFEQGYSTVGDWHSSAPDGAEQRGRGTRFSGFRQECGIHLPV